MATDVGRPSVQQCKTSDCGKEIPAHFAFCDACQACVSPSIPGRYLAGYSMMISTMFAVFGVEGFSALRTWPVFFFLVYLYVLALMLGARFYAAQRSIGLFISLLVLAILLLSPTPPMFSSWLGLTFIASLALVVFLEQPPSLKASAAILLASIWLYCAVAIHQIHIESDLATAIHALWLSVLGEANLSDLLPSVVTVVATRFYLAFLAVLVAVGISQRRRQIASLSLPALFAIARRHFPLKRFRIRPQPIPLSSVLDRIFAAALWVAFPVINLTAYIYLHFVFVLLNVGSISLFAILYSIRAFLRVTIYTFTLLLQVIIGFLHAGWQSIHILVLCIAAACLLIVIPVLCGFVFIRQFGATAAAIDRVIHNPSLQVLNMWEQLLFSVAVFAFGICIPIWSVDPRGTGAAWWREIMIYGIGLDAEGWNQFKRVFASEMNFLRNICVRLIPAYFLSLVAYDVIGKFLGGPYQFGYLFWTCLMLFSATLLLNVTRGKKMWRVVR